MKYVMIATLILIYSTSMSQIVETKIPKAIKIGEATIMDTTVASLSYSVSTSDTFYVLTFDNAKYTTTYVHTVSFNETGGVLNSLYKILSDVLEMKKGDYKSFTLGEEEIVD